jgi:hypothetical protein
MGYVGNGKSVETREAWHWVTRMTLGDTHGMAFPAQQSRDILFLIGWTPPQIQ